VRGKARGCGPEGRVRRYTLDWPPDWSERRGAELDPRKCQKNEVLERGMETGRVWENSSGNKEGRRQGVGETPGVCVFQILCWEVTTPETLRGAKGEGIGEKKNTRKKGKRPRKGTKLANEKKPTLRYFHLGQWRVSLGHGRIRVVKKGTVNKNPEKKQRVYRSRGSCEIWDRNSLNKHAMIGSECRGDGTGGRRERMT